MTSKPIPLISTKPRPNAQWLALAVVLLATFMAQFDLYVVNVALPLLQSELGAGEAELQLIVGGYAFVYAAGLITAGRLGDRLGHRKIFLLGMAGFGLTSLLCGLAQDPLSLTLARLAQGLAASAMVPQVLALISLMFRAEAHGRALSAYGVTIGLGAVAGQLLGGLLIKADLFALGWRMIFLVNLPIALIGLYGGGRLLPLIAPQSPPRLDPLGSIGLPLGLGLALLPLTLGPQMGWPLWCGASLALSLPVLALTLLWERRLGQRGGDPLIDLALFRQSAFCLGLGLSIAICASFFSLIFCLSLVLQKGLGLAADQAGLAFAPLGLAFALASLAARRLAAIHGKSLILLGTAITAFGIFLLLLALAFAKQPPLWSLILPMVLIGFGNGTAVPLIIGSVKQIAAPWSRGF